MSASRLKLGLSLGIGIALLTSGAGLAHAATSQSFSGTNCKGVDATEQAKVGYSPYGIQNNSASAVNVVCPVNTPNNVGIVNSGDLHVRIYDRSSAADVSCSFTYHDTTGAAFNGGSGTLAVGAATPPTGFNITGTPTSNIWGGVLNCSIPGTTASGISYLASYRITTSP